MNNEQVYTINAMQILKTSLRDDIIRVATQTFKTNGYEQASLRQIAKQVGMSVGNIYRYYPNKAALFKAVVEPALHEFSSILQLNTQDYEQPIVAFKELIDTFVQVISCLLKENPDALFVLLNNKDSSDMIQAQLIMFLKQLASEWYQSMNVSMNHNELLMEMLGKGIFNGIIYAVDQSESLDHDSLKQVLSEYLNLHLLMTYAVKEQIHETY
jgi:AcrR family transcriptional regulator